MENNIIIIIGWFSYSVLVTMAIIVGIVLLRDIFSFMRKVVNKTLTESDKKNVKVTILLSAIFFIGGCLGTLIFWWFYK